jgi:hypothetical protein
MKSKLVFTNEMRKSMLTQKLSQPSMIMQQSMGGTTGGITQPIVNPALQVLIERARQMRQGQV